MSGYEAKVVLHVFTDAELEELVNRIAEKVMQGRRPESVKVPKAAEMLGISQDTLRRNIAAKVVRTLPCVGPVRVSMEEIGRLNGEGIFKKRSA